MLQIKGHLPLQIANTKRNKSLEKLASGLRLNRAADGAAELGISESMKAQIRGMNRAEKNVSDGISLIQTAEGALEEIHTMLKRMGELSVQSANGIYESTDRSRLEEEIGQLKNEINRIAESSNFNGIPLLDGYLAGDAVRPINDTLVNQAGQLPQSAVMTASKWEGTVDISSLVDGATLDINGVVFEFDTDGSVNNSGANKIVFTPPPDATSIAAALQTAIDNDATLDGRLSSASCTASGSSISITLNGKSTGVTDGEKYTVASGGLPPVTHGSATLEEGKQIAPGFEWGNKYKMKGIDLDSVVDGTVIEINGRKFEVDLDGSASVPGATAISIPKGSNAAQKSNVLTTALTNAFSGDSITVGFYAESGGTYTLAIDYQNYAPPATQPVNVGFNTSTAAAPAVNTISNTPGVNTPAKPFQPAVREDRINFSMISEGSVITWGGHIFEFAANMSTVTAPGHIWVDMSDPDPEKMADAFRLALVNSALGSTSSITLDKSEIADGYAKMRTESNQASTTNGLKYDVDYDIKKAGDDTGIVLQIGITNNSSDRMRLNIDGATVALLNIENVDVSSAESAKNSMKMIVDAVDAVSKNRANLGASQNRLESTRSSLQITAENVTAAEDRLSSADMAKEMMEFTKEGILAQSAQGMLAQAQNLSRSLVQQLIQGLP